MLIIGELINATRKPIREAVLSKDKDYLQDLARKQDEAGAHYLDVNVATGTGKQEKEVEDIKWAVQLMKEVTEKPLAVDTTSPEVMKAGLEAHGPGAMVNSVSAEEGRLHEFIRLAKQYDCQVIALPVGEGGIPKDVAGRLEISREILKAAEEEDYGIDKFYFDPLLMPLGVDDQSGKMALEAIRSFKAELKVKTTVGLSNVSHGMPQRALLNRSFLALALYEGLDSAIMNPLEKSAMSTLYATLALMGQDTYCGNYLRAYRRQQLVV